MTTATYEDFNGDTGFLEEIYKVPDVITIENNPRRNSLNTFVQQKEESIKHSIEASGGKVLTLNTELITKRRFKRRMAKELKRQARRMN